MTLGSGPVWQLVLAAARRLGSDGAEFRLQDLVAAVQRADPGRERGSIQPVVQGMTANAGTGPPSPCGRPLFRVAHGWYRLLPDQALADPVIGAVGTTAPDRGKLSGAPHQRDASVEARIAAVISEFPDCLTAYDHAVPFSRSGQYEWHRRTIDRRRRWALAEALTDDELLDDLFRTLQAWGIGRRASRLVPQPRFRQHLRDQADNLIALEDLHIDDRDLDADAAAEAIWSVVEHLRIVENDSLIVSGTKTLHHLLPDLVPPMDRAWTGRFFAWSLADAQYAQWRTFRRTYRGFVTIARATDPRAYIGVGWRTSRTKIIDNAIIGYLQHAAAR